MKILGSILILFSAIFSSYYYEKGLKRKIKNCEEIIDFISHIKVEIEYFSNPLNIIYEKYDKKSDVIFFLIEGINTKTRIVDKVTDEKIFDFFNSIGKGFKKEQIAICDHTIEILNNALSRLVDESPKKIKVFRSISLFFSISTIILFI